jgi:hypothetical protein
MKAFRFPLERALHVRRTQLEVEQSRLEILLHQREQLELQGAGILTEAASTRHAITKELLLKTHEISTVPDYQRNTKLRLARLDRQKQELMKVTQDQKRLTLEAERKVKLLEQLRDKRFSEWNSLAQKEQETFAADAYLARWAVTH